MKEPRKKTSNGKVAPEHTVRCGQVQVAIYQRQSNSGFTYRDFTLNRVWQSVSTQKEQFSNSFFTAHNEDLKTAIDKAVAWVIEKENCHVTETPSENQ